MLLLVDGQGELRSFSEIEEEVLELAIRYSGGNFRRAALGLKLSRSTLYRHLHLRRMQRVKARRT
jgi:DNA-binding NtrC family response regulator